MCHPITCDENGAKKMVRILTVIGLVIIMSGCASSAQTGKNVRSSDPGQAMNKNWQWESTVTPVERIRVTTPGRYSLLLGADGKAKIQFDCNRGGGEYQIANGKLSFGPLFSTRRACPEDSLSSPYMRDLQRVVSFFVENGQLYLELPYDSGTMRFREVR
jgi:heat shock protein HslJ